MSDGSTIVAVLRLLVSLGAVLTLVVWIARYAAKRGLGARTLRSEVTVDVLSRRSLGRTSSVQVVQVGRRTMVLGVTEHGVSVLAELDDQDLVRPEAVVPDETVAVPAEQRFEHALAARIPVPQGWPWSAATFVLRQVQARRG